jgi:hypothetical protein
MVNLGFMIPTDKKHENMLKEICNRLEQSEESLINYLIEKEYKIHFGG